MSGLGLPVCKQTLPQLIEYRAAIQAEYRCMVGTSITLLTNTPCSSDKYNLDLEQILLPELLEYRVWMGGGSGRVWQPRLSAAVAGDGDGGLYSPVVAHTSPTHHHLHLLLLHVNNVQRDPTLGEKWRQHWQRLDVDLPETWDGKRVVSSKLLVSLGKSALGKPPIAPFSEFSIPTFVLSAREAKKFAAHAKRPKSCGSQQKLQST